MRNLGISQSPSKDRVNVEPTHERSLRASIGESNDRVSSINKRGSVPSASRTNLLAKSKNPM